MAELYRFFDGTQQDPRVYEAADFAEYFKELIRSGVFQGGDKLQVRSDQVGMKTYVTPGKAWLAGYFYKNTSDLYLDHNAAHSSLDRIDRVVLRLDRVARLIKLDVLTGEPSNTPAVPELTRSTDVLELALAQVRIKANSVSVSAARIADERYNENVCGIVTHLFEEVNTGEIFQQFQTAWDLWFGEVRDTTNLITRSEFVELENAALKGIVSTEEPEDPPLNYIWVDISGE